MFQVNVFLGKKNLDSKNSEMMLFSCKLFTKTKKLIYNTYMNNPTDKRRVNNCMNTLKIARETCNCYFINSCGDDIVKYPRFEHLKVRHYSVSKDGSRKVFVATITFDSGNSIDIDIPVQSETFSYSAWEFGFQWQDGNDRRSISFALDTASPNWDDFNQK